MTSQDNDSDFLFQDEEVEQAVADEHSGEPWQVLIVDDDTEIHSVTKLALAGVMVLDRPLSFVHAYSAAEARKILVSDERIAMVLLDVVMETDNAGLELVKQIREDLGLHQLRIVLRTGQPGFAPEEKVIRDYDINDYKTKTELTRGKLVSTVYTALRSYQQLINLRQHQDELECILQASEELQLCQYPNEFARQVIQSSARLFSTKLDGMLCYRSPESGNKVLILGGSEEYAQFAEQAIEHLHDASAIYAITQAFQKKGHQNQHGQSAFYIQSGSTELVLFLHNQAHSSHHISNHTLDMFLHTIATGFINLSLVQKLHHTAYYDRLTGLSNRAGLLQALEKHLAGGNANSQCFALIDIRQFSELNDGLGQEVGNALLCEVSNRLQELFPHCFVGRLAADVFGVIGPKEQVDAEAIHLAFVAPFVVMEHRLYISAAVGLREQSHPCSSAVDALKQTNIALNQAKRTARDECVHYQPEMEEQVAWRQGMIRQLRTDFSNDKLELWYQPQFCLKTHRVTGVEALLRWPDQNRGYVSPATFIPLAEHSGLIMDIGPWVMEKACLQLSELARLGHGDVRMAVNISVHQFRDSSFQNMTREALERHKVQPEMLEIEITESVLIEDPNLVVESLTQLKQTGISIALDDFGTGFCSLSYLNKLPVDRLKVDRSFVSEMHNGKRDITEMVIALGRKMGLSTLAEGVETESQLASLEALECDELQGYLFAKPMPAKELAEFLKQHKAR